jgi:hypothetical protein
MRRKLERVRFALAASCGYAAGFALAGTTVIVTDTHGVGVQSDVYRAPPAPEERLGQTDAKGRLVLSDNCTPNILYTAHPPDDYTKQGARCSAGVVRIEVTPLAVMAQLESNFQAAKAAGNQPAIAQIAIEIADRTQYADIVKSTRYRNFAAVASARTASRRFNASPIWGSAEGVKIEEGGLNAGQISWGPICQASDLLTCTGPDAANEVAVMPSRKLKYVLEYKTGLGSWDAGTNIAAWSAYSKKDSSALMYTELKAEDFKDWEYVKAPKK